LLKNSIQDTSGENLECGGLTPLWSRAEILMIRRCGSLQISKAASSRRTPNRFSAAC